MKILITSGGNAVKIDSVRSITNMSHGTLGTRMAKEFLEANHEVIFFRAEGSKSPMSMTVDIYNDIKSDINIIENVIALQKFYKKCLGSYCEFSYKYFEDYQTTLEILIKDFKPDVIILAAAISDYAPVEVMEGKIRTKDKLCINLKLLPKVISSVRDWAGSDCIIIGFKLLVDTTEEELVESAFESLNKNDLDYVCANDLRTILNGNHELIVINGLTIRKVKHTELTSYLLKDFNKKND